MLTERFCRAIEAARIPAILQHPAYKADPWATIRLHASNSLELKPGVGATAQTNPEEHSTAGGRKGVSSGGMEGIEA